MAKNNKESKKKEVEEKKIQEMQNKEMDKRIMWVVGISACFVALIIAAAVLYPYIAKKMSSFEYQGLTFTKEKFDKILVYHYYYYFKTDSGDLIRYHLYLRLDPRTNDVPTEGTLIFPKNKPVYVSINSTELQCEDTLFSTSILGGFLSNNLIDIKPAILDKSEAKKNNLTYVSCLTNPKNVVIEIVNSSETRIDADGNCYRISVNNCEILKAIEKFEVKAVVDAKNLTIQEMQTNKITSLK